MHLALPRPRPPWRLPVAGLEIAGDGNELRLSWSSLLTGPDELLQAPDEAAVRLGLRRCGPDDAAGLALAALTAQELGSAPTLDEETVRRRPAPTATEQYRDRCWNCSSDSRWRHGNDEIVVDRGGGRVRRDHPAM